MQRIFINNVSCLRWEVFFRVKRFTNGSRNCHVDGKCFVDDEEVETEVPKWLRQQSKDFYAVVSTHW
jgi:hypothetical protein